MGFETDTEKYANAIFAVNLLAGLVLFLAISGFYPGVSPDKSILALGSLTAPFALGIVNRQEILQSKFYAD